MNIILTTIGRKSGQTRLHEVSAVRDGNDYITSGSNGGAAKHSQWYINLAANPQTRVKAHGRTIETIATVVTDEQEYKRLWQLLVREYPVYELFQRRTSRQFPIVRLSPA
ncbi:MAG TPA: nitroreductase/quinone reductase family protein [Dictyobacter sp.]|jgi:deazaflavin-dependent oxidoreductase (nitroreductase family)|nr:nitroreductase/quinone reductase family protein [Dictyobacter sp.]